MNSIFNNKSKSINNYIENKLITSSDIEKEELYDNEEETEEDKLDREFILKTKSNSIQYPKNYGNLWTDKERDKILKYLKKNNFNETNEIFDEIVIIKLAKKLERTEYGIKEEIKKMIFNEYLEGFKYDKISEKFNIPETNIKLLIKLFIKKNGKKYLNSIEYENTLLKLKIENIKLKKELEELI